MAGVEDFPLFSSSAHSQRHALSTQLMAVAIVIVVAVAGLAGYFLLAQPGSSGSASQSTSLGTSAALVSAGSSQATAVSATSTAANSPINIGDLTELTGSGSVANGWTNWHMQNLAAKEINDSGGIMGHPIHLIKYDDTINTAVALTGARVLDQTDDVLAITGTQNTDMALAVHGYVEANGVPYIVPVAASPDLTAPGSHWTLRLEINSVGQGASIGKWLASTHPGSKVALVTTNNGYQRQEAAGTRYILDTYTNDSMSIVYDQFFTNTQTDWTAAVAAIKIAGASYVEYNLQGGAANLNAALFNAGYTQAQVISTSAGSTLAASGANIIGEVGETFGDETSLEQTANGTAFVDKAAPILNACSICLNGAKVVSVTQGAYYDYAAIYFIASAIKSVLQSGQPLTRTNLISAMRSVPLPNDPNGYPQRFDSNGAMQGPPFYIEQTAQFNATTQKYHGAILKTYVFGNSLPVYNITKLPTT